MMATTLSIENRRDDYNGRPARASIETPPGGTFLALDNDGGGNAGDAMGAEDGGVAKAGLDGLLMPPPSALSVAASAAATSSYSHSPARQTHVLS
jgi:hypothetical protein